MGHNQKKHRIDALNFQRKQEIFSVVENSITRHTTNEAMAVTETIGKHLY
jgi:hypothetical protein